MATMTTAPTSAPPKPRLALTVGIIGHRPNRLPKDPDGIAFLEKAVADVLAKLHAALRFAHDQYADGQHSQRGVYRSERPLISLASALADGADRIAARAAIAHRDYALDAPLPFLKEEYEKDFEPRKKGDGSPADATVVEATRKSIEEFHDLIRPAIVRSVLELPGTRRSVDDPDDADANKAYEAVGLTVLGQADILLTIWDGGASRGRGGTPDMLNAAARLGVPIIHVDAKGAVETCVRWSGLDKHPHQVNMAEDLPHSPLSDDVVRGLVMDMVKPPEDEAEREALDDYLGERRRRFNGWLAFPALMSFFGVRGLRKADLLPVSVDALTAQLGAQACIDPAESETAHPSHLTLAFGWADAIATRFGQVFRSAFVTNFLFAALAVATVAVSLVAHDMADPQVVADLAHHKIVFVAIEILFIFAVLLNTMIGRRYGWHRRWLESREVAERLRVALPLWTLGARPGFFFGPEPSWTGWYVRAILREQGLRSARFDARVLRNARDTLLAVLTSQRDYHASTAARMDALGSRNRAGRRGTVRRHAGGCGRAAFGGGVHPLARDALASVIRHRTGGRLAGAGHRVIWHPGHRRFRRGGAPIAPHL